MKKFQSIVFSLLLFSVVILADIPRVQSRDPYWYEPTDISILDNAYNTTPYFSLQWWYLDAVFTNKYSIHIGILSIGAQGTYGFFLLRINVYYNLKIIQREYRIVPLSQMQCSPEEAVLKIRGDTLLKTFYDTRDHLCVLLKVSIDTVHVNLTFTGETQGWKGYTGHGMWGCPLPKASVEGILSVDDTSISVEGTGYQERGWDVRRFHRSWFWGKLSSSSNTIVFSQNMQNRWKEDFFLVMINLGKENYTSIHRENIVFTHSEYMFDHGRLIPMKSIFEIHENNIDVIIHMSVQSIDFHRLALLRYWRFHMQVTGTISVNGHTEEVDELQIMEFCHFF